MNSQEEMTKLNEIAQILGISLEEVKTNQKKISEYDATYYWSSIKGGLSVIVAANGEYLGATSGISFEKLLEEFKNGKRNGKLNKKIVY